MDITFNKLITPDKKTASILESWSNDPIITHLIRPNQNQNKLEEFVSVTIESLEKQLTEFTIYLIYLDGQLVGEMNFQIDPGHLFKQESKTAWIGLVIGEKSARGKGIGYQAIKYLEGEVNEQKLIRIELGVFEFNLSAINLYQKMGYQEIGRINDFTYWKGKMWQDLRMEKYL